MARYGCTITVAAGKIPSSQSNFSWVATEDNFPTAAIDGGSTSIDNGGGNLRCYTDSTKATQIPIHVVYFVTGVTPSIQVHGNSPSLDALDTVYIEADTVETSQPTAGSTYGQYAVYADEILNHHLETSSYVDSVDGGASLSNSGTPTITSAVIGNGVSLDSGDSLTKGNVSAVNSRTTISVGGWINLIDRAGDRAIMGQRNTGDGFEIFFDLAEFGGSKTNTVQFAIVDGATSASGNSSNNSMSLGLHHVVGTFTANSGSGLNIYIDGALDSDSPHSTSGVLDTGSNADDFFVGARRLGTRDVAESVIDEPFIYAGEMSADRIEAKYNNESDPSTFWTTSAWEDQDAGGITVTESLVNTNYATLDPAITLTGTISITESVVNTNYTSLDPTIEFTGTVSIVENLVNTNYTSLNPTVTLTSTTIQITESLVSVQYQSKDPSILLTPEPIGIVSTVCFNGELVDLVYNGQEVSLEYNGQSVSLVFSGQFNELEFNGTIQTTCNTGSIRTDC